MHGVRRKSRSRALQMLYQNEINQGLEPQAVEEFWRHGRSSGKVRAFTTELVEGTTSHMEEIDSRLSAALEHWKLSRLSVVVRSLLRMAVYEMIILEATPFQVVINESVELAREYMDEDSAKFVNSVLEKCRLAEPTGKTPTGVPLDGAN